MRLWGVNNATLHLPPHPPPPNKTNKKQQQTTPPTKNKNNDGAFDRNAHLLTVLMQITGSKVCTSSPPQAPCGSMQLSRRSSLASGGSVVCLDVDGSPTDDTKGADSSVSSCTPSVSNLMALKELDSQMETIGLMSSLQPLHCKLFPTRDRYLGRDQDHRGT